MRIELGVFFERLQDKRLIFKKLCVFVSLRETVCCRRLSKALVESYRRVNKKNKDSGKFPESLLEF